MKFGAFSSLLATLALVCSSVVDAKYTQATSANFDSLVNKAKNPVVVVFCAEWSGPCKQTLPSVDNAVAGYPQVTMIYVNIDQTPEFNARYQITAIPTFKGINKNQVVNTYIGPMSQSRANTAVGELVNRSF